VKSAVAALAGILFGAGLAISQMTNPNKVLSFLDFSGGWDPSLALVMGAALAMSALGYQIARHRSATFFGDPIDLPPTAGIDVRLLAGATLFGVGWGLAGFCPGPALAATAAGRLPVWIFVCAMVVGMILFRRIDAVRSHRS